MRRLLVLPLLLASGALPPAAQANPHDGYAFWLPSGTLKIGDAASEKAFSFKRSGGADTFTVPLRRTRFDVPRGDLFVVPVGSPLAAFAVPRSGADAGTVDVTVTFPSGQRAPSGYRFYLSDDAAAWENVLRPGGNADYGAGIAAFFRGDYAGARSRFERAEKSAKTPEQARYARRFARWCDAEIHYPKVAKADGKGYYNLGLYAMVNGFWELAERSFRAATLASPKNPDAWYMLGDAVSYAHSDLDNNYKAVYPYYRRAADLYPRTNANTYRNHLGLFKQLKVEDNGNVTTLGLTPEQIADTKEKWEFCSAVMEAASKGSLRMVNTWVEYDDVFDNTAPMGHDPAPYEGLFEAGTVDTFMKFTGWGASDAIGHDCGPSRSASVNIGMREWDVLLHEWNHTLDWLMINSGLGFGVPETHSSDWCGFQPIPSMGMGHHSCNRYYMTPGMYRAIRGSDPAATPWIEEWLVTDAKALPDAPSPITDKDFGRLAASSRGFTSPLSPSAAPDSGAPGWAVTTAMDGYVDLGAIERKAPRNAVVFAHIYVWSPADMKVRIWFGADDNARIWINNALTYDGLYWSTTKFEEARAKDQIATAAKLRRGWNSVLMQVTNVERVVPSSPPPKPFYYGRPDAWGFSMRLCDYQNRPIEGMRWQAARPPMFDAGRLAPGWTLANSGKPQPRPLYYQWEKVKDDYTMDLPRLTRDDLRALTGYRSLTLTNEIAIDPGAPVSVSPARLAQTGKADPNVVRLDNHLNWFFSPKEMVATLRYHDAKGTPRDLVFLRPEMYEAFFALAKIAPDARARGIKSHADRVIGYTTVERSDSPNGRVALVLDTYLGANPPVDEEDLLGFGG